MRFKQRPFGRFVFFLCVICVLTGGFLLPVFAAQAETQSAPVSMDVAYGYESTAKSGRYAPVRVSLENQTLSPFHGIVRITAMESDYDIYDYEYLLQLEAGEQSEAYFDVPAGRADVLYVRLISDDGVELVKKRLKMNVSPDVAELFVGVLSDSPEKLAYLNGVGVNYSSVRTRTFSMTTRDMPDRAIGLDSLDVLLITNYNTADLEKGQVNAIWEWVKSGGVLLIGTGARAGEALSAFRTELLSENFPQPDWKAVDMGVEYATNGPGNSFINLICADISLKGGVEVLTNDELPVLTACTKGNGTVGVAAYDFVDIAEFCETQRSYVDKLLTALLGEEKMNYLSSYLYSGGSSKYWSVQNMLNTGDVDRLPNLPLYVAVILAYLLLIGPGLYLFLKKQERRRFYRPGVLALSALFVCVIYLMGSRTRFREPFVTYATVLDTSGEDVNENTYINMRTPYHKPYEVSLDSSYDVIPITRSSAYYDMTPVPKFTGDETAKVRIRRESERTRVTYQSAVSFSPGYYSLTRKLPNPDHEGLTGDLTVFEGRVNGTVTNHYPFAIEKAAVLLFGQMVPVKKLEAGETLTLNNVPVIWYPLGSTYMIAERVTGGSQYTKTDIEDPEYIEALTRTGILSFYLENNFSTYHPQARIVGFCEVQPKGEFLEGGEYETYGLTMLTSDIEVKQEKNGNTYRSGILKKPAVVSGQYYADGNAANGIDPVTLEYSLGNDITVDRLDFVRLSRDFTENEKYGNTSEFVGTMYFYNHDTGVYDPMESGKASFMSYELKPYLSPGNTLTVRYLCDYTAENNWYVLLPMPMVLGRDR